MLAGTGCADDIADTESCALGFEREGDSYYPHEAAEPLQEGRDLGTVRTLVCDDGAGPSEQEVREAVAIRGVDPAIAFIVPSEGASTIFAVGPPDGSAIPDEIRNLLAEGP
ncbi:DUF6281 family protein [Nocardioides sp. GCM10027113]|uniref:DUF6281 family protein n=1 Tax=unclassified Nocardioides TaxID=2615069 RepID=UPI00360E1F00